MVPTVGRIVHYWESPGMTQPTAAIITAVHSELCVSLCVFPFREAPLVKTSVMLRSDENPYAPGWSWPERV